MGKLGFYFNQDNCVGCMTCQIACKDTKKLPVGIFNRKVDTYEVGSFPNVGLFHYSGACNHCAEPACVKECPTGATYMADDGTVCHDAEKCIGCESCAKACPYGHPSLDASVGIIARCDACKPLRDQGLNPQCVDSCCMRVLEFGDLDELRAKHEGEELVSELPFFPESSTQPSLLIRAKKEVNETDYRLFVE